MSPTRVPPFLDFVKTLCASGLIEKEQLRKRLESYRARRTTEQDVASLAKRLLDEELLTEWQLRRLLAGISDGFFLGKYRLLETLGEGGMGIVYKAEHTLMQRYVALKVLSVDAAQRPDEQMRIERFHRESQATAALDHRHIVRVHDFDTDGNCFYLVMEYIQGQDLFRIVKQYGPLPVDVAISCLRQAALGLGYVHARGLIHRDVKPSNLLRDTAGTVKLLDLGIALVPVGSQQSLTLAGNVMLGTADYQAPEQVLDSHAVDARADIYALGCTFYYLLTGEPPYPGGTKPQKMLKHLRHPAPSLVDRRADVSQRLEQLCHRMMAKSPDDRYASCEQLGEALDRLSRPEDAA